jgi:ABC-type glycerol-3-phosphate transport system substrate-binding protein
MKSEQVNFIPPAAELERQNLGVASFPYGPAGSNMAHSAVFTIYYYINKASEQVPACWQWISYLSQQPGPVSDIPARVSVAESAEYEALVGPQAAAVYRAAIRGGNGSADAAPGTTPRWMRPGWSWAVRALEHSLHGADLVAELQQAQERWNRYRDCVIREEGFELSEVWTQCAVLIDPALADHYR